MKVRNSLIGKEELNNLCEICDLERTYEIVEDLRNTLWDYNYPQAQGEVDIETRLQNTLYYVAKRRSQEDILYSYSYRKGQILDWLKKRADDYSKLFHAILQFTRVLRLIRRHSNS